MENISPGALFFAFVGILMAVSGFTNTVGSAAERIAKIIKAVRAPNDTQDEQLAEHREQLQLAFKYLERDFKRLETLEEGNRITQRALMGLLAHGIDGNNIEELEEAKKAIQAYLINK